MCYLRLGDNVDGRQNRSNQAIASGLEQSVVDVGSREKTHRRPTIKPDCTALFFHPPSATQKPRVAVELDSAARTRRERDLQSATG